MTTTDHGAGVGPQLAHDAIARRDERPDNVVPAPSSPIATAARRFGDDYPLSRDMRDLRMVGVLVAVAAASYLPWMVMHLNRQAWWLSGPFLLANLFSLAYTLLQVVNMWGSQVPPPRTLPVGAEPVVGIIIPTCGEDESLVMRTVHSVLEQDWPHDRMVLVISDDGASDRLRDAAAELPVLYHRPPPRNSPGRDGAAKAGNLNSAMAFLDAQHPGLDWIETRDADDEMGTTAFLRQVMGQLVADDRLAFVQTIKEAQVSAGDPFNNRESMFYRGQMLSRNAANAVFPCGSGVVWRRSALDEIGGFPTWNLVEDLQSGVEALRRGWRGLYLPIVGAVGQHAPQDVPNVYKQRGTWAIDTVRLMVWGDLKGLRLRQRLQFLGMAAFYVDGFTVLVYLPSALLTMLGVAPLVATGWGFLTHVVPQVVAIEVWLLVANRPFADRRTKQRHPVKDLWRARILWTGLAPVYIKATVQAVLGGRHRKPVYKVTRKTDDLRWHWRETLPQTLAVGLVAFVGLYVLIARRFPDPVLLACTAYWGTVNLVLLAGFVSRGWHGLGRVAGVLAPSPAGGGATVPAPRAP